MASACGVALNRVRLVFRCVLNEPPAGKEWKKRKMKTKVSFPNSGSIEATMEITMTIKEWGELSDQLYKAYPGWVLAPHIRDVVIRASTHFTSNVNTDS